MPTKILRYREDMLPVSIIFGTSICQFLLYLFVPSLVWTLVLVIPLMAVQQLARAALHYHHHLQVFTVGALNRLYEVAMFLQTGLSPFQFTLHHVYGHHDTYLDPTKDALRWKWPDGRVMTTMEFIGANTLGLYAYPFQHGHEHPQIYRRFIGWLVFCLGLLALLVAWSSWKALIVFIGPMSIMLVDIIRLNLWHHVGIEADNHLLASRNDLGYIYNLVTFNSGYHTAHHIEPARHWSRLPALHATFHDKLPPELLSGAAGARATGRIWAPDTWFKRKTPRPGPEGGDA